MARSRRARGSSFRRRRATKRTRRRNRMPRQTRATTSTTVVTTRRLVAIPTSVAKEIQRELGAARALPLSFNSEGPLVTGVGSAFYVGAGELISHSPFATGNSTLKAINFTRAKVNWISVKIIPSAQLSERGGQLACAIVPAPFDVRESSTKEGEYDFNIAHYSHDVEDIALMRNGKVASATKTMTVSWKPTLVDGTMMYRRLGLESTKEKLNANPVAVVVIGFSDFAAKTNSEVKLLYSASRSMFDVEIKGSVTLCDPTGKSVNVTTTISHTTPVAPPASIDGFEAIAIGGECQTME